MPVQIHPDHLSFVQKILARWVPRYEVWAFGSRVHGQVKLHSDLDLVVINDSPLDFALLAQLRDEFSESNLSFKVDLVQWCQLSESFQKTIKNNYEPIQTPAP